jgi:hypothetical protein
MAVPILLNAIVGYAVLATNEYQASAEPASPQNADMPDVAVAFTPESLRVPAVLEQDVPEVKRTAFPQASFAGCANEIKGNNRKVKNLVAVFMVAFVFKEKIIEDSIKVDKSQTK